MSKRRRRAEHRRWVIAGWIILGGAVWTLGTVALVQHNQAYLNAQHEQAAARRESGGEHCWSVGPFGPLCIKDEEATASESERAEDDLKAQKDMANWAVWIAVFTALQIGVGLLGVGLVYNTLRATRKANRIARRSAERQLRAYIDVRPGGITTADNLGDAIGFVTIKNVGQIPATEVRTLVNVATGAKGRISFDQEDAIHPIGSLQPGAAITQGTETERWANLVVENEFIFVFGVVRYDDGFKRERFTKFCHRYRCADVHDAWDPSTHGYFKEARETGARQHREGNDAT